MKSLDLETTRPSHTTYRGTHTDRVTNNPSQSWILYPDEMQDEDWQSSTERPVYTGIRDRTLETKGIWVTIISIISSTLLD